MSASMASDPTWCQWLWQRPRWCECPRGRRRPRWQTAFGDPEYWRTECRDHKLRPSFPEIGFSIDNGIIADWIVNLERIISQSSGGCEDAHNSPDSVHGNKSSSLLDPLLLLQLARFVVIWHGDGHSIIVGENCSRISHIRHPNIATIMDWILDQSQDLS